MPAPDRYIARMSRGAIVLCSFLMVFLWVVDLSEFPRSLLVAATQGALVCGVGAGFAMAVLASKVTADIDGVTLQNIFFEHRISWWAIRKIDSANGLQITLNSGRTLGSIALGGSVIAALTGNRRQQVALAAIERFRAASAGLPHGIGFHGTSTVSGEAVARFFIGFTLFYSSGLLSYLAQR